MPRTAAAPPQKHSVSVAETRKLVPATVRPQKTAASPAASVAQPMTPSTVQHVVMLQEGAPRADLIPPAIPSPAAQASTKLQPSTEATPLIPREIRPPDPVVERTVHRPIPPAAVVRPAEPVRAEFARAESNQDGAQAGNRIHIGAIDIHISPPPQAPPPRRAPAAPPTAISRSFTSSFGLRQG
jgi:hypothetical protein